MERDSSWSVIASRSASSTMTNSPLATSQPLTISSGPTSRSWVGHQRFCRIGVLHSRWRVRKLTSDCFAFGVVASARPTGMLTRPKLMDPFQIVRMAAFGILSGARLRPGSTKLTGTGLLRRPAFHPCRTTMTAVATTTAATGTRTIARLWQNVVEQRWPGPAYLVQEGTKWREMSWQEAARAVDELANGLLALGVRKGDAFAILGSTRVEWALFDFALGLIGAVGAPVYMNSSPKDTTYVVHHSEAIGVLCEDDDQRAKLRGIELQHVLTFTDLDDLRARGRAHAAQNPSAVEEAAAAIREDDLFTYIYTSGTTGPPKACMITHRNYYEMADKVRQIEDFTVADDTMLLYLPLAHNFGRLMHLHSPHVGYTLAFCPDPYAIAEALPVVRPTVFPSVPRVYEKVHTGVSTTFAEA